jgi:hypothetical protein
MPELKHTVFMKGLQPLVGDFLDDAYQDYKIGETRWFFQVYFGRERRIHYEVARPYAEAGRRLEIGLHIETRNKGLNRALLEGFARYLLELRDKLDSNVVAEQWDRGWSKVYETYPGEALTEDAQRFAAERLATFIHTIHPIYKHLREKEVAA